ncbi:DUF2199 domain-containing protein [Streptomyces sp. NBC_01511]|uniref:DUF2199 domain-containing protein n=1 Tax=unclassified Streptomyces TaxID=2593676 RepID=UPI00386E1ED4
MTSDLGFACSCCGAHHPELPMNYTAEAPAVWDPTFTDADDCLLSSDRCVIQARGRVPAGAAVSVVPLVGRGGWACMAGCGVGGGRVS